MIKVSATTLPPLFYLPVKDCLQTRETEYYLFFIAPIALVYEICKNILYITWMDFMEFNYKLTKSIKTKRGDEKWSLNTNTR